MEDVVTLAHTTAVSVSLHDDQDGKYSGITGVRLGTDMAT